MPSFANTGFSAEVDLENYTAGALVLSTSAGQTAALPEGNYALWCASDCYVRVAPTATGVTTTNGYLIRANTNPVAVRVRNGSRIGAIVTTGTPTLYYHQVG